MPNPHDDPHRTAAHVPEPSATGSHQPASQSTTGGASTYPPDTGTEGSVPAVAGYEILGELARGGMGRVLNARDLTLDREVAVKVLLPGRASPAAAARFVTEAKVTARLPHPGVPPVHQLGELADGSPFLAMKLIKGRTLSELLKERRATADDLPRFVQVFEQVCQTVGFAHARGIVHRDLKPLNVMVGEFGEVQVMDWGLAKEMRSAEREMRNDNPAPNDWSAIPHSEFRTPYSQETQTGAVLGTPGYMAPEQARGEPVDCRADVFSLGAVLCVILTGKPANVGASAIETVRKAAAGDLSDALARLDACGADAELVALARQCLSPQAKDRPANGKQVADAVAAYRAGVEERLQTAERERTAAETKATEQRKRRKVQLALFAALGLLLAGGGAFAWWEDRQAQDARRKQAEFDRDQAEAAATQARLEAESAAADERARQQLLANVDKARTGVPVLLALAVDLRKQFRFREAGETLDRAAALLTGGVADELKPAVEQAKEDLAFVRELDDIRYNKWVWISEVGGRGRIDRTATPRAYREAFLARGIDPLRADAAARIDASAVRNELIEIVWDWYADEPDRHLQTRLLAIMRSFDAGSWTEHLGSPDHMASLEQVAKFAESVDVGSVTPIRLTQLAVLMQERGLDPSRLLIRAQLRHPTDFDLAFELGMCFLARRDPRAVEAFAAARALRPDHHPAANNLACALEYAGGVGVAEQAHRLVVAMAPQKALSHNNLAVQLHKAGRKDEAVAELREALRLRPTMPIAHNNLGVMLHEQNRVDDAIQHFRAATRLRANYPMAYSNLGAALQIKGNFPGALAEFRQAVNFEPKSAPFRNNLGAGLFATGDYRGAMAEFEEAIKLDPKYAVAHNGLGRAFDQLNEPAKALKCYREAVRLDPNYPEAHLHVSIALFKSGDSTSDEQLTSCRELVRLRPTPQGYNNLGTVQASRGDWAEARKSFEKAVELNPNYATGQKSLGDALQHDDELKAAEARHREAARLDPKRYGHLPAYFPLKCLAPPPREAKR